LYGAGIGEGAVDGGAVLLYAAADAGLFQMQNTCNTGKNDLAL